MAEASSASPALLAAIEVFHELGWPDAQLQDVATLPLGSEQQRAIALKGLRSGDWQNDTDLIDRERALLTLFAVRVGVTASRALKLMTGLRGRVQPSVLAAAIASRGREFSGQVTELAYRGSQYVWDFPATVRLLVTELDLPLPRNSWYTWQWSAAVAIDLGLHERRRTDVEDLPSFASAERRFTEHVELAIDLGTDNKFLAGIVTTAVHEGLLERSHAITLVCRGLDTAVKPTHRSAWAKELATGLKATEAELGEHADLLVQAMALGPAQLVGLFAPALIRSVGDDLLGDALTVALSAKTKKAVRSALQAAVERGQSGAATTEDLVPLISDLATDKDRGIAGDAQKLLDAWQVTVAPAPEEETPGARGLWHATPALWEVPRLDLAPITADEMVDLVGKAIRATSADETDCAAERFLALAQQFAYDDAERAREVLGGLRGEETGGWRTAALVHRWVIGEEDLSHPASRPLAERSAALNNRLDAVPCVLSTPTWVDLRISPADLVERLRRYAHESCAATEGDLYLALTRLDVTEATDADRKALAELDVPLEDAAGGRFDVDAATTVLRYLDDPVLQPESADISITLPDSMSHLPDRFGLGYRGEPQDDVFTFPTWSEPARELDFEFHAWAGSRFRQLVRRRTPLTTALANRLLEALHRSRPGALADTHTAAVEAWQRGLLPPGTIVIGDRPKHVAGAVEALLDLSEDGLAAVAWDVLGQFATSASDARSVPAGTQEVVEALLQLLPEARAAIDVGIAGPQVLNLPGVRRLAERSGSSKAVVAARSLVAQLPAPVETSGSDLAPASGSTSPAPGTPVDLDFWPDRPPAPVIKIDGLSAADDTGISVALVEPNPGAKTLRVDLALPGLPGKLLRVWEIDHRRASGSGTPYDVGTAGPLKRSRDEVWWFAWDAAEQKYVIAQHYADLVDNEAKGPLPAGLAAVVLANGFARGPGASRKHQAITRAVDDDTLSPSGVRHAIRAMLTSPEVNPQLVAVLLEKHQQLIPVLWPVLTESVRAAGRLGSDEPPPRWLGGILGISLALAPILAEAARTNRIPAEDAAWVGLDAIADRKGKGAAITRARELREALARQAQPAGGTGRPEGGTGREQQG